MELPLGLCAALRDRELVAQPERLREGEGEGEGLPEGEAKAVVASGVALPEPQREGEGEGEGLPEADDATEAVRVPEAHWLALREGE